MPNLELHLLNKLTFCIIVNFIYICSSTAMEKIVKEESIIQKIILTVTLSSGIIF